MEKLAQTAYNRTDPEERRDLICEAFFRTVNNGWLQRYYLAVKISTIEEAMDMGWVYYQVDVSMELTSPPIR